MPSKETLIKWGFIATVLLTIVLYLLLDRKSRKLDKLIADAKIDALHNKIMDLNARAAESEKEYEKAYEEYKILASHYPDIVSKLGLQFGPKGEQ